MNTTFNNSTKLATLGLALQAVFAVWALGGAQLAQAQALPQAGQVNREAYPITPPRDLNPLVVTPPNLPAPASAVASVSVKVSGFRFTGNDSVKTEDLQRVVADNVNQTLDLAGLDKVAARVSRFYRSKGYTVATAYLPPQQSADGSIQIAIIEGQYANINLKNTSSIATPRLQRMVAANLCEGVKPADCKASLIRDVEIERTVLLVKDLPGITAVSTLKPGAATGTSDLELDIKDVRAQAYSLGYDNYGSKSTGIDRFNFSAEFNNPNNNGDQLTLGVSTTGKGSNTGSLGYSFPVGYTGGRMGVAFARGQYRLGAGFDAIQSHGTSNTLSAYGSYPIVRSVNRSLYLRGSSELRGMYNSIDLTNERMRSNATVFRGGLNGDGVDSLGGGGYMVYGLMATSGHLGIGSDPAGRDALVKTAGSFSKLAYNIARQQAISGPLTLYGSLFGQQASKNLDASEQIGIGGPTAVRGYAGEAGGSIGAVATLELRYTTPLKNTQKPTNLTYGLFVDRGWVDIYKDIPVGLVRSTRALTGYGVSTTVQSAGYYLRAIYAGHRASEPSVVDNDSHKFWVQGGLNF